MKREGPGGTPDSDDGTPTESNRLLTDGSGSYCAACHRSVAREDRVDRDGDVYHRQCAPDDVVDHRTLDELRSDGGLDARTPEERERRARQSGIGFVVRCRKANVDPHETLDHVLEELDDVGPDDDDDREPKAVLPDGGD